MLQQAAKQELNRGLELSHQEFEDALSAENFVAVRTIYGGPAPTETQSALAEQRQAEHCNAEWLQRARTGLSDARLNLENTIRVVLEES
jgi:hypothetical protein